MTRIFNDPLWEKERIARIQRMEIAQARKRVSEGREDRYAKPGLWRVFRDGPNVVTEIFGETK